VQTEKNIATFRRQLKMLGFSYDWSREIATTDVAYFRWTQWIFLQIYDTWFDQELQRSRPIAELPIPPEVKAKGDDAVRTYQDEHRLAYQSEAPVNWCPALGTVLANEEVIDGKSERGGYPVVRMPLRQWMLRITAYADRLEKDLEGLDWHEGIKALQRNWIGRSTGAEVDFYIGPLAPGEPPGANSGFESWKQSRQNTGFPQKPEAVVLRIYTTRPDTLFGATYMVIAPEHPFVERLTTPENRPAVAAYREQAAAKSDLDRTELAKEKTGVFTGSYAVNPVNGEAIPIWIADYVLISYGTGAIMAVPAHDERDFQFARQYELPIRPVVQPGDHVPREEAQKILNGEQVYTETGPAINSDDFNGLTTPRFKERITAWLAKHGLGRQAVNYKLRDWLFSRQRFWGEPFPILHELDAEGKSTGRVRAVPEDKLPVDLPHLEDFKPHGRPEPPLDKAPAEWLYPVIDGKRYKRETNTMPQWAGSCWYYLRFLDPTNAHAPIDKQIEKAWMPVDLYIGGAEHAVLHLLYSRFWHKVLYDRGIVSTPEPFQKLVNQGMILGENNEKMSKARGNVVNPDDVVKEYGADALRLYEMFMGPLEATKPWSMEGVNGVHNFLGRAWRMIIDDRSETMALNPAVTDATPNDEELRVLHRTIKAVTDDVAKLSFNTAISRMMEFTNFFTKQDRRPRVVLEPFVLLLSPFAPHIAEELWEALGHAKTLAYEPWPQYDPELLVESTIELPVQINGKVRSKITVPADADNGAVLEIAKRDPKVADYIAGKPIVKEIVIPSRLVNIVIKG
jgi:leucyl-tRNA synthetase